MVCFHRDTCPYNNGQFHDCTIRWTIAWSGGAGAKLRAWYRPTERPNFFAGSIKEEWSYGGAGYVSIISPCSSCIVHCECCLSMPPVFCIGSYRFRVFPAAVVLKSPSHLKRHWDFVCVQPSGWNCLRLAACTKAYGLFCSIVTQLRGEECESGVVCPSICLSHTRVCLSIKCHFLIKFIRGGSNIGASQNLE